MSKVNYWFDPGYKRMVEKLTIQVKEQKEVVSKVQGRLEQYDIANPQAKAKASIYIGGLSHYFDGSLSRKVIVNELTKERGKLKELNIKLKEYKELLAKSKQVA